MISSLIELGDWLIENNLNDFGKTMKDDDFILRVSYVDESFVLNENFVSKEDFEYDFFESVFNEDLFFPPKPVQNFMIPNANSLSGFTPFVIKITDKPSESQLNKFVGKSRRALESHFDYEKQEFKKNCRWNIVFNEIYENSELNFFNKCAMANDKKAQLKSFINEVTVDDINILFKEYYEFINKNVGNIINKIMEFKDTDEYKNSRGEFFLVCVFKNHFDLINDILLQYSMFIKDRNNEILPEQEAICSFCGNKEIVYPSTAYFGHKPEYCFNNIDETRFFKFRICKKCNFLVHLAESKLKELSKFNNNMLIVPHKKDGDFKDFLIKLNEDCNSFKKLNKILRDSTNFNYDLVLYNQNQAVMNIKKYIENYRAFLITFENLLLCDEGKLNYLYDVKSSENKISINNLFDLEKLFKDFFIYVTDDKVFSLNNDTFYFYQIYTSELTGKNGLLRQYDSVSKSLFFKYMQNIFNLIYEVNLDALSIQMLNEITLNSLKILQKNNKRDTKGFFIFRFPILYRLNNYLLIRNEFLGGKMLDKENLQKFIEYLESSDDKLNEEELFEILDEDIALKYYWIGQFIRYIDNFKYQNNKNSNVFSNFVANVHRKNIRKLFVDEILLKNQYYINQMSKKGKFLFKIFERDLNALFNENDFKFEDYIILMFTGYYTNNILSIGGNNYGK